MVERNGCLRWRGSRSWIGARSKTPRLNRRLEMTDRQTTHGPGCWGWGPKHYECAVGQVKRDEALLRQVLEALSRAHQTAMKQTLKARIPECAEFAGIAQDLDFVVTALRERLGEGGRDDLHQGDRP